MDYQAVLNEVESWPVDDRVRLVQEVWDRLQEQAPGADLTDEVKAELDRRIEEADRDPAAGVSWEVVESRLLAKYGR